MKPKERPEYLTRDMRRFLDAYGVKKGIPNYNRKPSRMDVTEAVTRMYEERREIRAELKKLGYKGNIGTTNIFTLRRMLDEWRFKASGVQPTEGAALQELFKKKEEE